MVKKKGNVKEVHIRSCWITGNVKEVHIHSCWVTAKLSCRLGLQICQSLDIEKTTLFILILLKLFLIHFSGFCWELNKEILK